MDIVTTQDSLNTEENKKSNDKPKNKIENEAKDQIIIMIDNDETRKNIDLYIEEKPKENISNPNPIFLRSYSTRRNTEIFRCNETENEDNEIQVDIAKGIFKKDFKAHINVIENDLDIHSAHDIKKEK